MQEASAASTLLPLDSAAWFQRQLTEWGRKHLREFPWRDTQSPYEIFVAECLLQQTDAPRVEPVYQEFLELFPSLIDLAQAERTAVREVLQPLGFHFRADRMHDAANALVERGKFPQSEEALLGLPGVGPYIASAIRAVAFAQPVAVLDTNVARILQRFFGLSPRRARVHRDPDFWKAAQQLLPPDDAATWNLTLLDFGAAVCTARKPKCDSCPLVDRCAYTLAQASEDSTEGIS